MGINMGINEEKQSQSPWKNEAGKPDWYENVS
jgi:hypothetical protein